MQQIFGFQVGLIDRNKFYGVMSEFGIAKKIISLLETTVMELVHIRIQNQITETSELIPRLK